MACLPQEAFAQSRSPGAAAPPTRTPDVAVTGIGLVTPAGTGREASWDGVCSGRPTAATDPELAGEPVDFSCRVRDFDPVRDLEDPQAWRYDRCTQFALAAAREAVGDAGLDPVAWPGERVGVVLGTAVGGISTLLPQARKFDATGAGGLSPMLLAKFLPNMAAGHLSIALGARGPSLQTSTACAAGATAVGLALFLLRSGACDIVVAGGAEAGVIPMMTSAFARMRALSRRTGEPAAASRPFDRDRDGFVMGEGAGVLVLERAADAARRGRTGYALLAGYGATSDAHHPVAPHPEGRGARAAIRAALADAGAAGTEVDHVNAHGTSTPLNDAVEGAALRQLLGTGASVTSTKGVTGHLLGAAGAVEAAFTALTIARGLAPPCANLTHPDPALDLDLIRGPARPQRPTLALSNSFGFGGHNAVLAFRPVAEVTA
ncbi:beta-ketoacyl-[acyl-carrier-protein] synthase family protein [Streptomyces indicus]|uniref:3-oxoacyl-[acyl-carrier-protein] synthase II n=1 Tax=Streptomyces indicus TaxID=417292 RepID=A0A1G9AXD5_9ACTN|nr:beta-ketoacyl-[acyl-carrier-protein] synthase family protein [Streptomyces indicus]SDK31275.1 3-oxoacyl-[acyl-carrier-protein] synthase II [Streptomyces indicus]